MLAKPIFKVDKVDLTCGGRTQKPHPANDQPGNRTQNVHCNQTHTGEKPNHIQTVQKFPLTFRKNLVRGGPGGAGGGGTPPTESFRAWGF